jgi:hypothetical protein
VQSVVDQRQSWDLSHRLLDSLDALTMSNVILGHRIVPTNDARDDGISL